MLDEIGVDTFTGHRRAGGEIPVERANHAAGDGAGELPERRSDSQHRLPLLQGPESPNAIVDGGVPSIRTTARSLNGSDPTRVASRFSPSERITSNPVPPRTTCSLVTMLPEPSMTNPVPRPASTSVSPNIPPPNRCSLITVTTPGITPLTIWDASKVTT